MAPKDGKQKTAKPPTAEERAVLEEKIIRQIRNEPLYRDEPRPEEIKEDFEINLGVLKEPGKPWEVWQYAKSFYTDHDFIVGFMALKGGVSGLIAAGFLFGTYLAAAPFLTAAALVAGIGALATIGVYGVYVGAKGTIKALKQMRDRISGDKEEWVYKENNLSPEQAVQFEKAKVYRFKRFLRRKAEEKGVTPEVLAGVMPELVEEEKSPAAQKISAAKRKTVDTLRGTRVWQWAERSRAWQKFNDLAPVKAFKKTHLWRWTKTIVDDNDLVLSTLAIKGSIAQLLFEAMIFTTTVMVMPFVAAAAAAAMVVGTVGLCALAIWHSGDDFVRGIKNLPKRFAEGRERDKKLRERLKRKRQYTKGLDVSDVIEERAEAEEEAQKEAVKVAREKASEAQVKTDAETTAAPKKNKGGKSKETPATGIGVSVEVASKSVGLADKGDTTEAFDAAASKSKKKPAKRKPANDDTVKPKKRRAAGKKPDGPN